MLCTVCRADNVHVPEQVEFIEPLSSVLFLGSVCPKQAYLPGHISEFFDFQIFPVIAYQNAIQVIHFMLDDLRP